MSDNAESTRDNKAAELARVFAGIYATAPELSLDLLRVIRAKWFAPEPSVTDLIARHVLTNAYHQRPIVRNNEWIQQGVFHKDATAREIQTIIGKGKKLTGAAEAESPRRLRGRISPPSWRPMISTELNSALQYLRERGFDVGLGW